VRGFPALILTVLALAVVGAGAFRAGRDSAPSAASTPSAAQRDAPSVPATRRLSDPSMGITFSYPSELRRGAAARNPHVHPGKRSTLTAGMVLASPRLGFLAVERYDDSVPAGVRGDTRRLARAVTRQFRASNPGLRFRASTQVVNGLPVVDMRVTNDPHNEVIVNAFVFSGATSYRLVCHEVDDPARRAEMRAACEQAFRTVAPVTRRRVTTT
jgi:hypothetical protein